MQESRSEGFRRAVRVEVQYLRKVVETQAKLGKPRQVRATYSSVHAPQFVDEIRTSFPDLVVITETSGKSVSVTIAEAGENPATVAELASQASASTR